MKKAFKILAGRCCCCSSSEPTPATASSGATRSRSGSWPTAGAVLPCPQPGALQHDRRGGRHRARPPLGQARAGRPGEDRGGLRVRSAGARRGEALRPREARAQIRSPTTSCSTSTAPRRSSTSSSGCPRRACTDQPDVRHAGAARELHADHHVVKNEKTARNYVSRLQAMAASSTGSPPRCSASPRRAWCCRRHCSSGRWCDRRHDRSGGGAEPLSRLSSSAWRRPKASTPRRSRHCAPRRCRR